MEVHQPTGRWRLGLALALVPAVLWGTLPIALRVVLDQLAAPTIAWYRLAGSGLILALALALHGSLPPLRTFGWREWTLTLVAGAGLAGNYLFWLFGIRTVSPATSSVVIQVSPLMLAPMAFVVYRERFSRAQWIGFAALVTGLGLWNHDQLATLVGGLHHYAGGVAWIVLSACSWCFYAMAQKQLLTRLPSQAVLLLVYVTAAVVLAPGAHPATVLHLDYSHRLVLVYCVANTLVAYGALAEAMNHWEASRVAAVLPLSPLFTLWFMHLLTAIRPGVLPPEHVQPAGLVGAVLVVSGAALTALSRATPVPPEV